MDYTHRTDAQHEYLAGLIGADIDTEAEGIVYPESQQAPDQDWCEDVLSSKNVSTYRVRHFTDGLLTCDCPGFKYRDHCKHLAIAERQHADAWARTIALQACADEAMDALYGRDAA